MVLNFVEKVFSINGGGDVTSPFTFYKNGFELGSLKAPEPTWQDIIISGNTALTLVNAKADGLNYVKLFGGGENRIMLPAGYTQYTYIRNGQGATINTDWRPTVDDIVLDIRFYCNSTGSMYLWQSRDGTSGSILGLGGSQSGSTISLYGGGGSTPITSSISRTIGNIYHIIATLKNGNATLYVKDETAGVEDTQTGTYTFGVNATRFYFFGNANQYVTNGYRIYSAKCWYQGRLIQNWAFTQNENEESGIYNLIDGTFITNANTWVMGEEINNPSPDYPMNIVCNNGILKVDAQKQIYADGTTETVKDSLNNTATAENLYGVYSYNDEQNITTGAITRKTYAVAFDGSENWSLAKSDSTYRYNISLRASGYPDPYTPTSNRGHIISTHFTDIGGSISKTPGGAFTYSNIYLYVIPLDQTITTAAAFKSWLAQQKAEGTPLIVVYERNTAATESVTHQTLTTQRGTNIIEITQASIDGLPLEVSYKAGVSVTITEVQNANLSNSVTVTIGE